MNAVDTSSHEELLISYLDQIVRSPLADAVPTGRPGRRGRCVGRRGDVAARTAVEGGRVVIFPTAHGSRRRTHAPGRSLQVNPPDPTGAVRGPLP